MNWKKRQIAHVLVQIAFFLFVGSVIDVLK